MERTSTSPMKQVEHGTCSAVRQTDCRMRPTNERSSCKSQPQGTSLEPSMPKSSQMAMVTTTFGSIMNSTGREHSIPKEQPSPVMVTVRDPTHSVVAPMKKQTTSTPMPYMTTSLVNTDPKGAPPKTLATTTLMPPAMMAHVCLPMETAKSAMTTEV